MKTKTATKTIIRKTYCARNIRPGFGVPTHECTGGSFCQGDCKPKPQK